jgi:ParB-like chromosome segregation protein Spo0J
MEIQIDPEFQAMIPPLADEERRQLEANLVAEGCRDALIVWPHEGKQVLIDGHNRYEICTRLGIEFKTTEKEFESKDAAKIWMIDNQKGRRNLTDGWKWELAQAKKKILEARGKENQRQSLGPKNKGLSKVDKPLEHNTQQELAKELNWSTGKVAMADKVWKDAKPEIKEKVRQGEVSINQAYQEVRKEEKKQKQEEVLHARSDDKARKTAKLKNSLFDVRRGDFREVLSDIEAVSLVLTDPPYPKESLPLWRDLGKWAADALADDGILVAYSGQMYLPDVLNLLSESLEYWWCGAVVHKGTGNLSPLGFPVRKVINGWKPLVMFYKKGGCGFQRTFRDLVMGVGSQKDDHNWQQPVEEAKILVEAFTLPGELVVDPFAGSGGFCKAAHECGRIAVGAEILQDA